MKPTVGVILSDTSFRRPIGDVGNPDSYSYPVIFHVARGATAAEMVQPVPNMALLETYLQGALELQRRGASLITTTCGFLVALQEPIAKRLASKGYSAYVLAPASGTPSVYRVRVGKFPTRREAESIAARLQKEEQLTPWITR